MKKFLVLAAIAVFSFTSVNAQDGVDKVIDQAKNGGFYIGANAGFSVLNSAVTIGNTADDYGSFNFGVDVAYLFEVANNIEVGLLVGYTQFLASGKYTVNEYDNDGLLTGTTTADFKDSSFVPISSSARYYFADRKFFGGLDLGYAINVAGDENVNGGLFLRPKFGFNLGKISLIGSYQRIFGNSDYTDSAGVNYYTLSGFASFNVGAEFHLN